MLRRLTIRGRAAFVLAIAEKTTSLLNRSEQAITLARAALDLAWEWEQGSDVSGDSLYNLLENYDDQGLLIFEWESPENEKPAWVVLTTAVAYVAWHAYRLAGETVMPSSIHEVTEKAVCQVIDFAMRLPNHDPHYIDSVFQFCLSRAETDNPNDLGRPIDRGELLRTCCSDEHSG